jgi:hypothetical protein
VSLAPSATLGWDELHHGYTHELGFLRDHDLHVTQLLPPPLAFFVSSPFEEAIVRTVFPNAWYGGRLGEATEAG